MAKGRPIATSFKFFNNLTELTRRINYGRKTSSLPPSLRVEKLPRLFLQAKVAHRRQRVFPRVFPVPVGLSRSALHFCSRINNHKARIDKSNKSAIQRRAQLKYVFGETR